MAEAIYLNLFAVIVVQALGLFGALWVSGRRLSGRQVATFVVGGILVGALYDLAAGAMLHIFSYSGVPPVQWTLFILVNGAFSYGVALATAWTVPAELGEPPRHRARAAGVVLALLLASAGTIAVFHHLAIQTLFAGIVLLSAGELLALACGRSGPIIQMVNGRRGPVLRVFAASVALGGLYESANAIFPVWKWTFLPEGPGWLTEMAVIGLGYFVLFHPLLVVSQLLAPARNGQES